MKTQQAISGTSVATFKLMEPHWLARNDHCELSPQLFFGQFRRILSALGEDPEEPFEEARHLGQGVIEGVG